MGIITMNPGYAGRATLPEGLKALFRPMTVMVPDMVLICENMLMAEGFTEAKVLASKFYGLYALLRDLLSAQKHYDWGLRAVKSVLRVAGSMLRAEPELDEAVSTTNDFALFIVLVESLNVSYFFSLTFFFFSLFFLLLNDPLNVSYFFFSSPKAILMRALRDSNTAKIIQEDEPIFFGLLGDLFPGLDPPRKIDPNLKAALVETCEKLQLWPDTDYIDRCMQLAELLSIRHCVFLLGPPGCGRK